MLPFRPPVSLRPCFQGTDVLYVVLIVDGVVVTLVTGATIAVAVAWNVVLYAVVAVCRAGGCSSGYRRRVAPPERRTSLCCSVSSHPKVRREVQQPPPERQQPKTDERGDVARPPSSALGRCSSNDERKSTTLEGHGSRHQVSIRRPLGTWCSVPAGAP